MLMSTLIVGQSPLVGVILIFVHVPATGKQLSLFKKKKIYIYIYIGLL